MDSPRKHLLEDGPPPPVRSGPAKPIVVLTCGGIVAALLLIVIFNIEQGPPKSASPADDEVIELIPPPRALTDADRRTGEVRGMQPLRAERGWIETRRGDGSPAQRYRCEALDPSPEGLGPGWLEMTQPRMEIYSDKRVVTIAGDTALAFAPQRAVEQGSVKGNVLVQIFDAQPGQRIDVERDQPAMAMRTEEASFENFLGEIRADGRVVIESPTFEMPGRRLSVLVDDQNDEVRITVAQVEYIRIVRSERDRTPRSAPLESHARFVSTAPMRPVGDAADASRFYTLTIQDNVQIDEGTSHARRTATGDRLEVTFSSRTEILDSPLAIGPADSGRRTAMNARAAVRASPAPLVMATVAALPATGRFADSSSDVERLLGPNITLIRASGPLTIEPLRDPSRALAREEDARIKLTGRPVRLCDFANASEVTAQSLVYETNRDRIELSGTLAHPLRLSTPEMEAGGERWHYSQHDREGGFDGRGWMTRRDRSPGDWIALACASRQPQPPARRAPQRAAPPDPEEEPELHITWEEGVDLQFSEEDGGRVRSALFVGNVKVASADFDMSADQMAVRFAQFGRSDSIESIHATGEVDVAGVFERSAIRCADLHLDLLQTQDGRTIPQSMVATGEVLAFDEEQVIWADELRIRFREAAGAAGAPVDGGAGQMGALLRGRGADVDEFIAERDVQVVLADGTRVFAERLVGDGVNETVELTAPGGSVTVVSDRSIIDQAARMTLDRKSGASVPGAGQFRLYQNPILPQVSDQPADPASRVERPTIDEENNPLELRARWLREMTFEHNAHGGAGSVDLRGGVTVTSEPSPLKHNTMIGESLTLDFAFVEAARQPENEEDVEIVRSRRLAKLVARQDAKIESHTWENVEARAEGEPQIFYIAGQHVEYHALAGNALVVGDGTLVIHDLSGSDADAAHPFGAKGSTVLTWDGRLELKRRLDNVFDVTATRNVRLRHRALDEVISTLMCDELNATALRTAEGSGADFDFGGSARLQRVRAAGAVEIVTDQRTINCGEFDYNVEAGVANMTAAPNRDITIRTAGTAFPMHAQSAVWNMQRDTINITQGRGRR